MLMSNTSALLFSMRWQLFIRIWRGVRGAKRTIILGQQHSTTTEHQELTRTNLLLTLGKVGTHSQLSIVLLFVFFIDIAYSFLGQYPKV